MIGTLLKLFAYTMAPKATLTLRHPIVRAQLAKTPFDLRTAYAPRLVAVATALIVGPLAYRVGRRIGEGALRTGLSRAPSPGGPEMPSPGWSREPRPGAPGQQSESRSTEPWR